MKTLRDGSTPRAGGSPSGSPPRWCCSTSASFCWWPTGASCWRSQVVPGLTLGILLGALVIVASWILTWVYVRWAATHYDPAIRALDREPRA